ncbi:tetratricopeptide repeat protein [Sneathiella litorea]|uniref:Sel1 repeat family protein n=1 Tax=Sneathiella litorea TaxID=2606216 RepID=A0A6L8WA58_9PROT|nr:SEL1-like repeat protein [Sneathiella litorea]MZR31931.1 hypothetical protein [Sneathiella litorea]
MRRIELFTVALSAAVLVTLWTSPTVRADFNDGVTAYEAGDYTAAFNEWLPLAKNNDPAAMRNIGHMYRRGLGVAQDFPKAMTWYKRAATIGFDRAQANVAGMYLAGEGVEKDYAQAANWFARAAQQGHVVSQYNLALLLENGLGVEKNEERALGWFALAAKAGHPGAQKKAAELALIIKNQPVETASEDSGGPLPQSTDGEKAEAEAKTQQAEPVALAQSSVVAAPQDEPSDTITVVQVPNKAQAPEKAEAPEKVEATPPAGTSSKTVQKAGFYEALRSLVRKQQEGETAAATASTVTTTDPAVKEALSAPLVAEVSPAATEKAQDSAPGKAPKPQTQTVAAPKPALKPEVAAVPIEPVKVAAIPAPTIPKAEPVITAAALAGTGLSAAEKLEMADLAYTLKQYQQSLSIWAQLAAEGNAEAQYRLGSLFNAGMAVPVDRVRAYYWWEKARNNGSSEAAVALASLENSLTHLEKRQIDRAN